MIRAGPIHNFLYTLLRGSLAFILLYLHPHNIADLVRNFIALTFGRTSYRSAVLKQAYHYSHLLTTFLITIPRIKYRFVLWIELDNCCSSFPFRKAWGERIKSRLAIRGCFVTLLACRYILSPSCNQNFLYFLHFHRELPHFLSDSDDTFH